MDQARWLVSAWNVSKAPHRRVDGVFPLPAALPWRRHEPGLALPDTACSQVEIGIVPLQRSIPYDTLSYATCGRWQQQWFTLSPATVAELAKNRFQLSSQLVEGMRVWCDRLLVLGQHYLGQHYLGQHYLGQH